MVMKTLETDDSKRARIVRHTCTVRDHVRAHETPRGGSSMTVRESRARLAGCCRTQTRSPKETLGREQLASAMYSVGNTGYMYGDGEA